jgi:hypothetical protein
VTTACLPTHPAVSNNCTHARTHARTHADDGDMLTDEIAQVHRSPGFITSNLIGKRDDGTMIKEFEASHGTVADMWEAHGRGEETSLNPLGMVEALVCAMAHAESLQLGGQPGPMSEFALRIRTTLHRCMVEGQGTRDLCGAEGLTTEQFVEVVARRLAGDESYCIAAPPKQRPMTASGKALPDLTSVPSPEEVEKVDVLFNDFDIDGEPPHTRDSPPPPPLPPEGRPPRLCLPACSHIRRWTPSAIAIAIACRLTSLPLCCGVCRPPTCLPGCVALRLQVTA